MVRSLSRTSSVRIKTPGADKGPWATKAKKTSQPQVKGGADSEHVIFELVSSIQKENATLRGIVEQLKAEIAEIEGANVDLLSATNKAGGDDEVEVPVYCASHVPDSPDEIGEASMAPKCGTRWSQKEVIPTCRL
ncbi:hypothetical protein MRX96_046386 [Rhipicephalus microplus]